MYYPFIVLSKQKKQFHTALNINKFINMSSAPSNIHERIFKHFIFTESHHFLQIGADDGWLRLYIQLAQADSLSILDPSEVQQKSTLYHQFPKLSLEHHFGSLDALIARKENIKYDLVVIPTNIDVQGNDWKELLNLVEDESTFVILHPHNWSLKELKEVESYFPLILSTWDMQVMWRQHDGAAQKIYYTDMTWTKPWELIHAI